MAPLADGLEVWKINLAFYWAILLPLRIFLVNAWDEVT
jgi:hypothetical protein